MDTTKITYIFICLFALFFAFIAEKTNKRRYAILSGTILALYSGLRGKMVGIDTPSYYELFKNIARGRKAYVNEAGFKVIVKTLMNIFQRPEILILIFSIVIIALFYLRFWELRDRCSFTWMALVFVCCYFMRSMNIMRQYIAWAIVFWGTRYLDKKQYLFYLISVAFALLFHLTAIVALLFLAGKIFNNYNDRKIIQVIIVAVSIILLALSSRFASVYEDTYSGYLPNLLNIRIGFMVFYKLIVVAVVLFCSKPFKNNVFSVNTISGEEYSLAQYEVFLYAVGIVFSSFEYLSSYISRISLYFMSYEFVFCGQLAYSKYNRLLYKCLIAVFALYLAFNFIKGNSYRVFPYYSIFG